MLTLIKAKHVLFVISAQQNFVKDYKFWSIWQIFKQQRSLSYAVYKSHITQQNVLCRSIRSANIILYCIQCKTKNNETANIRKPLGGIHKLRLQDLFFFDHLPPSVYIFYGTKVYKKSIFLTTYPPTSCKRSLWTAP